jgi:ABC-type multidrug transport system fused ATPase/permease subunit
MAVETHELSHRARLIGVTVWSSFLAACVGNLFFWAFIAPENLLGDGYDGQQTDRLGIYTMGFFGLWLLAALSSALALYLNRITHGSQPSQRD